MKVAIYGKEFEESYATAIEQLLKAVISRGHSLQIVAKLKETFDRFTMELPDRVSWFDDHTGITDADVLISIGGDGTMLDTLRYVRDSEVPVLGINTGRLGFLSNITVEEIDTALTALETGNYTVEERSLIKVECECFRESDFPYALNEVTIHKKDDASMVAIHAWMNDDFVNTYWADGLIVSTATGSTAYSLSCGGPIVMPGSKNFIFTPIAPHNLNVRPLVVPNDCSIKLKAEGRAEEFLLTLDSQSFTIAPGIEVSLFPAHFSMRLVLLEDQDFFQIIRNKMLWGIDRRN